MCFLCSQPHCYEITSLPAKLPPPKKPIAVTSLPMLGYMEQSVATSVINALGAVGYSKPKYPFLDPTKSALVYIAYHLKGKYNNSLQSCYVVLYTILALFDERNCCQYSCSF